MTENSYPYPSTLNIDNFVTIKLSNSSNYSLWKAQIICLLESQELVGFIDGTNLIHLPSLDLKWKRSDRLVKGWIFGSLAEEMFQYVVEKISARDVWLELEKICCHNSLDNFQDFAMQLVKLYPDLAKYSSHRSSPLAQLATKTFGTSSVNYSKTPSLTITISWLFQARANVNDIENATNETLLDKSKSNSSELEYIRDKKWKHQNAIKLAECLCEELQNISEKEISAIVGGPLLQAAHFDNYKLVEIIVTKFPSSIYYHHENGKNILHVAVENRSKNVFKLVSQMNQHSHHLVTSIDSSNNTMLHLAGKLSEEKELKKTFGAALNMQEGLRWFEAVKQILPPSYYQHLNNNGKTAHQVFTEQHSYLRIQGEKWMKDTSSLCAIIATLIVTIAFSASITFPEIKNCENALPISFKKGFLTAFIFSNTVSLSTSCISLFAFVSILTSRYAEEDFSYVFPKRLLCGLLMLYASVEAMMLSFGCALYFVLKDIEMVFYVVFIVVVLLPILAFQHW
ncbi:uncharacterized protein LOC125855602 [Solanum stenotomum]|uniref:uncharacterized protein LOC125855602 n=1 Tax=Solanum stenotomum TaxID=172797 RepID=UPI0020D135B6|nr:uncharacterized protein LOC125855602 [Solanum stenotomum]